MPQDKAGRAVIKFTIIITLFWYLYRAGTGWLTILGSFICFLPIAGMVLFCGLLFFLFAFFFAVEKRQEGYRAIMPFLIVVLAFPLAFVLPPLPSKPEMVFRLHHDEFIKLTELAVNSYKANGEFTSPESDLYTHMSVYTINDFILDGRIARWKIAPGPASAKMVVEFVTDDFYLPLVFVADDQPNEVYNTCSSGGVVTARIEPHWYICSRDSN